MPEAHSTINLPFNSWMDVWKADDAQAVVLSLCTPTVHQTMRLTPVQAQQLADALVNAARECLAKEQADG
jgi:hypothetical protein